MKRERVYLVTGASGFVGRVLCSRLLGEGRVRALCRRPGDGPWHEAFSVDLASPCDLGPALDGVDTVFHLASVTDDGTSRCPNEEVFHRVNFEGTQKLFRAAAAAGVRRLVFTSSVKAMGREGGQGRGSGGPHTPYGLSKKRAEEVVLSGFGVSHVCVVRPAPVYGPGSKGNLARMIRSVARGIFPPIPDTENARSMVHVEDLVAALVMCAEKAQANRRVFVVTDGRSYSTRQIYEWILECLGRKPPRWCVPVWVFRGAGKLGDTWERVVRKPAPWHSGMVERLLGSACFDATPLRRELGFEPAWDLRRALPDMVRSIVDGP